MGSQWEVLKRGETWLRLWALRTSLAAEFWTFCSFSKRCLGREERVTIIKPREDKGGHEHIRKVNWKKMPHCANTAEFRVGRTVDIPFVQFYAYVKSDVKTKISGRRRKRYFTATDRGASRFGDWKGLGRWAQEEGLCFIIVKFKFVFQHPGLDVWQTGF